MIHPTALVEPGARLAPDVVVGPYSSIGAKVSIGAGTVIGSHVVIAGNTTIGQNNNVHSFCSLGGAPQDKKFAGEDTRLEIGDGNTLREYCTLNCGTAQDVGVTRLGNGNWIMAYCHIAHDCQVGNNTVFANNAQLGGHVHVGDYAVLGGFTGVHQFCHVGAHCITSVGSAVLQDLPPYVLAAGNPARPYGINSKGLRRRGFSPEAIMTIRQAFKILYRSGLALDEAKREIAALARSCPQLQVMLDFFAASDRGIMR